MATCCLYNPKKALISNHLAELSKDIDLYLTKYDQLFFLGNFNAGVEDSSVQNFCSSFNQGGLNKKEIQLNLCNIFSIFMFNELYLFA